MAKKKSNADKAAGEPVKPGKMLSFGLSGEKTASGPAPGEPSKKKRWGLVGLCAIIGVLIAYLAWQYPKTQADHYINSGKDNLRDGKCDEAIRDFDKAIELEPDNKTAYLQRGIAHMQKGEPDKAHDDFDSTLTHNPDDVNALFFRGCVNRSKLQDDEAIADFTEALKKQRLYIPWAWRAEVYSRRAEAYLHNGQVQEALSDYTSAITIKPDLTDAYLMRSLIYLTMGNYDEALIDFNTHKKLNQEGVHGKIMLLDKREYKKWFDGLSVATQPAADGDMSPEGLRRERMRQMFAMAIQPASLRQWDVRTEVLPGDKTHPLDKMGLLYVPLSLRPAWTLVLWVFRGIILLSVVIVIVIFIRKRQEQPYSTTRIRRVFRAVKWIFIVGIAELLLYIVIMMTIALMPSFYP